MVFGWHPNFKKIRSTGGRPGVLVLLLLVRGPAGVRPSVAPRPGGRRPLVPRRRGAAGGGVGALPVGRLAPVPRGRSPGGFPEVRIFKLC